jgi:hypothetical protein
MRFFSLALATLFGLAGIASAAEKPHAHRMLAEPQGVLGAGCLTGSRLLSHVAYVPPALRRPPTCGQPLSTDTVLEVRHWDRT